MKPLRTVVVGCGTMGELHARAWTQIEQCSVVSVYDPIAARCRALAAECGAEAASSWQEAIETDDVDIVSVCTPVCDHAQVACHALERGRHVLVEKPIALTLDQARRMIDTAERTGKRLGVSYQYRDLPKYRKYRTLIDEGMLSGPMYARFSDVREVRPKTAMHRVSMNGGPIIDMAGHYFDLMRYWTGTEPRSVYAKGHVFGRGKARLEGIEDLAIDAAEITVTMDGGHVLSAHVNWGMPEGYPALGHESLSSDTVTVWPEGESVIAQHASKREIYPVGPSPFGPGSRVRDMASAVREGSALAVRGEDGLAALRVSLAALESIRSGMPVSLE